MKILDMIKMCLQNLTRRKSRTILTVLGVVVGCCAIVTMMSIGFGVQNSQQIMLESHYGLIIDLRQSIQHGAAP